MRTDLGTVAGVCEAPFEDAAIPALTRHCTLSGNIPGARRPTGTPAPRTVARVTVPENLRRWKAAASPTTRAARAMARRRTNLALLVLLATALATGTLSFAVGAGWQVTAVTVAHGMAGFGVVLLTPWKSRIVRRGVRARPLRAAWPSIALAVLVVVTVLSGLGHTSGLALRYGPVDDMQVHVGAALATIPLTVWHVAARGPAGRRTDLDRRNLLRGALLVGSTGALYAAIEGAYAAARLAGADRRATGSFEQGSHRPEAMPATIWLADRRPALDPATWHLSVVTSAGTRLWSYPQIAAHRDGTTAVLDCTGGWFAEQDWVGARLTRLVTPPADARSIVVVSATGYRRRFPIEDLGSLLLATGYSGRPLAPRHGAPARLVAPGRRGFWWVKWVERIEVSDVPSWAQPPFPLT